MPRPAAGKTALRTADVTRGIVAEDCAASARIYNGAARQHARSRHSFATTSRRSAPVCATAGSTPTRRSRRSPRSKPTRRRLIPELEGLKRQQNTSGDEIARAKRQGLDTAPIQEANRARAQQIKQLGVQLDSIEHQRTQALLTLPNLPHASVPVGKSAADNVEVRRARRAARVRLRAEAALGSRPRARHPRLRARRRRSPARASRC